MLTHLTSAPSFREYALYAIPHELNAYDSGVFASPWRAEEDCGVLPVVRWPAIFAANTHNAIAAVGITGGFISEALS